MTTPLQLTIPEVNNDSKSFRGTKISKFKVNPRKPKTANISCLENNLLYGIIYRIIIYR